MLISGRTISKRVILMKKYQMTLFTKESKLFSKVLARAKRKEEQSQILCYQKEISDRVRAYRGIELDILEKMRKDKEEKESQATKDSAVTPSSAIDKGKVPMGDVPQASVAQQVKALIHTSQKFKQKLTKMTSVLDTQEVATTQVVADK